MHRPRPLVRGKVGGVGMKRLLVGTDRSANAATTLRWAANVAAALGADLVAVAAWTPEQAELPPDEWAREHRELQAVLDDGLSELPVGVATFRAEVVDGHLVEVMLARALAEDADLLVVGIPGRGDLRGQRVGSAADTLAHHTTRPVAVVPDVSPMNLERIVLGVDGSEGAAAATSWTARFASALHARVDAVSVLPRQFENVPETDAHRLFQHVSQALNEEWTAPLHEADVAVHPQLLHDRHVAEALIDAATRVDATAIVVGTHGLAPLVHMRIGGVAMRCLHATPLPLVLVPPQ
jgi:nucleotide-binding universal stress UspA family protein